MEQQVRNALVDRPQDGALWQLMTATLQRLGRPALHAAMQAAQHAPDDAVVQLCVANELARDGQRIEACAVYRRAVNLRGDFAEAHANLGQVQYELGLFQESADSCERALALNPAYAQAHHTGAMALQQLNRPVEALAHFRRAVGIDPALVDALKDMAVALRSIGRLSEAADSLERALTLSPDFAAAHVELCIVYRLQRRSEPSARHGARALESQPESADALAALAELRADLGDFAQAESLHRRALLARPARIESLAALAHLRHMATSDGAWLREVQEQLTKPLPPRRARLLHYALGKYFDDVQDFDAAFRHYRLANDLSSQCAPAHDAAALERTVDMIIRDQDAAWIDARRAQEISERPVFIVGMLRSGTTLTEQILASHPRVFGAGELNFWATHCAPDYAAAAAATAATSGLMSFGAEQAKQLGAQYLAALQELSADAARVVDKFPVNFFFLGLIHAALPQARFIHMQRDPRDTCLSIFFQQFEAANTYTTDLQRLADYYRHYRRLMAHWRAVLPSETLLEVPYEQLVGNPQNWTAAMLEFLGLPWNPRCLDFSPTPRTVVTASRWQVRQGLLTSSVGRWRHYEKHLGPLATLVTE